MARSANMVACEPAPFFMVNCLHVPSDSFDVNKEYPGVIMFRELTTAVILTIIFSIGVGVLFVRTLIEMVELFFNGDVDNKRPLRDRK